MILEGEQQQQDKESMEFFDTFMNEYCICHQDDDDLSSSSSSLPVNNNDKEATKKNKNSTTTTAIITTKMVNETHHTKGQRSTMLDLDPRITAKLDQFIRIDTINYRESLLQFLLEIAWMEDDLNYDNDNNDNDDPNRQSRRKRVFCDSIIQKWERELEYIGLFTDPLNDDDDDNDTSPPPWSTTTSSSDVAASSTENNKGHYLFSLQKAYEWAKIQVEEEKQRQQR